jgi:hypothetical protein
MNTNGFSLWNIVDTLMCRSNGDPRANAADPSRMRMLEIEEKTAETLGTLEAKLSMYARDLAREREQVQHYVNAGNREMAGLHLGNVRRIETNIRKTNELINNIKTTKETYYTSRINKQVLEVQNSLIEVTKEEMGNMKPEEVDRKLDEARETIQDVNDSTKIMAEALVDPESYTSADQTVIDDELDMLFKKKEDQERLDMHNKLNGIVVQPKSPAEQTPASSHLQPASQYVPLVTAPVPSYYLYMPPKPYSTYEHAPLQSEPGLVYSQNAYAPPQASAYTPPQANAYTPPQANAYTPLHASVYVQPQANVYTQPQASVYAQRKMGAYKDQIEQDEDPEKVEIRMR